MKSSTATILSLLTSLTTALPAATTSCAPPNSPFYLVTTTSPACSSNSTLLPSVSATSLFDPFQQPAYLLRLIDPGYLSLPNFTLADGALHTLSSGPLGQGSFLYNSTPPVAGTELQFQQSEQADGGLSLLEGYLLAVGGVAEGWTICNGALGQKTIQYKGTDASCNATYIQAVSNPPY